MENARYAGVFFAVFAFLPENNVCISYSNVYNINNVNRRDMRRMNYEQTGRP